MSILKNAKILAAIPAPSGFEGARALRIRSMLGSGGVEISESAAGSLIVRRKGTGRRVLLIANMDGVGFLATYREQSGQLRFSAICAPGASGLPDPAYAPGAAVISVSGVRGVIRCESAGKPAFSQMYIDAAEDTPSGDAFTYAGELWDDGGTLTAPSLGAALSSSILLEVLEKSPPKADLWLAFTSLHLAGARDASAVTSAVLPEYAVLVGAAPAGDFPGGKGSAKIGGGAVVTMSSGGALPDQALSARLARCAGDGAARDFTGFSPAALRAVSKAGAGTPAAAIGFALRGYATPYEKAFAGDAGEVAETLLKFIGEL